MKAAELFVKCLEREATPLFSDCRAKKTWTSWTLLDSNLRFILTRSEQAAAFMADVQGRLTGKASVCLSTLGPGATNLVTGVADANMDSVPLVASPARRGSTGCTRNPTRPWTLSPFFRPMTKYNTPLITPEIIPEVVRKAFKVAQTERYGATHIDFPEDVAKMEVYEEPLLPQQPRDSEPLLSAIEKAAECINNARFPILLAGNGVIRNQAAPALRRFVAHTGIPCANTFMAKGVLPFSDPFPCWPSASRPATMSTAVLTGPTWSFPSATTWSNFPPRAGTRTATRRSSTSPARPPRWINIISSIAAWSPTSAWRWMNSPGKSRPAKTCATSAPCAR